MRVSDYKAFLAILLCDLDNPEQMRFKIRFKYQCFRKIKLKKNRANQSVLHE